MQSDLKCKEDWHNRVVECIAWPAPKRVPICVFRTGETLQNTIKDFSIVGALEEAFYMSSPDVSKVCFDSHLGDAPDHCWRSYDGA
jgi:hypothetical protein